MASKKNSSQALKAVNETKKKTGNATVSVKKKEETNAKQMAQEAAAEAAFRRRLFLGMAALGLSILFLFMGINPEGALLEVLLALVTGMIGKVGFFFAIPALMYLFTITISSKGKPIRMRCICLVSFVLLSSCIHHMMVNNQTFVGGFKLVSELYYGGRVGTSGGLICGLIAMLIRWACGNALAYILFIFAAILTLLASMKITVPSILRAIQNRPRDDWQEEIAAKPEPAERVEIGRAHV